MTKVINDPAIKIVPLPATRPPSPASRLDTEMYQVVERVAKQMYPGVTVIPTMGTGASDQAQLRAKGQQSYGLGPASTQNDRINFGAHSDVERLAESSLYPFVEYVWKVVTEVAASRQLPACLTDPAFRRTTVPLGPCARGTRITKRVQPQKPQWAGS